MEIALSFLSYSFLSGITPGPANLCSLSTAIRKGKKTAIRQWRGLFFGYFLVALASAMLTYLVGTAFSAYVSYFRFIGAAYMVWLAIHLFLDKGEVSESENPEESNGKFREGTFLFGVFVQITNVKIMIFCLSVFAGYVLPYRSDLPALLLVACLLPFTGPICNLAWLFAGVKLQTFYGKHRTLVNAVMAAALILCAVSMIRG